MTCDPSGSLRSPTSSVKCSHSSCFRVEREPCFCKDLLSISDAAGLVLVGEADTGPCRAAYCSAAETNFAPFVTPERLESNPSAGPAGTRSRSRPTRAVKHAAVVAGAVPGGCAKQESRVRARLLGCSLHPTRRTHFSSHGGAVAGSVAGPLGAIGEMLVLQGHRVTFIHASCQLLAGRRVLPCHHPPHASTPALCWFPQKEKPQPLTLAPLRTGTSARRSGSWASPPEADGGLGTPGDLPLCLPPTRGRVLKPHSGQAESRTHGSPRGGSAWSSLVQATL